MRAAICPRYGPPSVLELRDVPRPRYRHDELLVRIVAATVNSSDSFIRSGLPHAPARIRLAMRALIGFTGPRRQIIGLVLAGQVEAVGASVTRFVPGDRVLAFTKFHLGTYAEYTAIREASMVARAPRSLPLEQSVALVYGHGLALPYLRRARVSRGERVVVNGAAGSVGVAMVQLCRHRGASVTGVCGPASRELVLSQGADEVLDYTTQSTVEPGTRFDAFLDAVGKRKTSPLRVACERAVTARDRVVSVDDGTPHQPAADLEEIARLADAGVVWPVIDRRYPLDAIVEAHAYVDLEHKKGNVVIVVAAER